MLNPRQQKFTREYIKDGNGQQAAIRAGYKPSDARVRASKLLRFPAVAAEIAALRAPIVRGAQMTMESHLADLLTLRDAARKARQYSAAVKAEELRGKVAGFYVERHAGPDGTGPIEVRVVRTIVRPIAQP